MELIQKQIIRALTTGSTTGCSNCFVFIPDTGVTYSLNVVLTQTAKNWGFFDTYNDLIFSGQTASTYTITGTSQSSRLEELRKYSVSNDLSKKYNISSGSTTNGLDLLYTTSGQTYTYYIDGIIYVDNVSANTTTFSFVSSGYTSSNFDNKPIIKDESKGTVIDSPIITNNVFIERQQESVFEKNYRLRNIKNLSELLYYAGGRYYNVVNNT